MSARLRLKRDDGRIFLERWGWENKWFGVYFHKIDAPDPGIDLHNHPWPFVSFILKGCYTEQRSTASEAALRSTFDSSVRGRFEIRKRWSLKALRLNEAHRIVALEKGPVWTVCFRGKVSRVWGFFTPDGYMTAREYEKSEWGLNRGLRETIAL